MTQLEDSPSPAQEGFGHLVSGLFSLDARFERST